MSSLVISLDFELFWGVADSQTLNSYQKNIIGEWDAIPQILSLFKRYEIKATWATVGMAMCRDHRQWSDIRPKVLPGYKDTGLSAYNYSSLAKEYPNMFFGRSLVERILQTPGQEVGGHSYSHFYCNEPGATVDQFLADLICAREIASELGVKLRSFVFPRNQHRQESLKCLIDNGYQVYRGNPHHWLYANGHNVAGGFAGRLARLADAYVPYSGSLVTSVTNDRFILNCPGSHFLRPWSRRLSLLESIRLTRLKRSMLEAAKSNGVFHLWWHPHNFGVNIDNNINALEDLLKFYRSLSDEYGMVSRAMGDYSNGVNSSSLTIN